MPFYSEDVVNEVFAENDIVDYVSQYVKLKKNGRDYVGLCPFHNEKSPSFHVNQEKQLFHCFGCGAGGNLVQFVMRAEGLDFVEALKLMADRAGIILPEGFSDKENEERHAIKKRIAEINRLTARFFYSSLTATEEGRGALDYLLDRKISKSTIVKFGLGYAPKSGTELMKHLNAQGYSNDDLLEAGVVIQRDGRVYDKFRGRVMFPIINLRGEVIGFGGRIMNDVPEKNGFKPPKYLNTGETVLFNKGKNLFALNFAKKTDENRVILCEGYMDVISVYQSGVTNIAATLGTALTDDQTKLLAKYFSEIVLCYDTDEAGQKATVRAIEIGNRVGAKMRVMRLKGAKDPDEYIKNHGVAGFKDAVTKSVPSTEYRISLARREFDIENPDGKAGFIHDAVDTLVGVRDAVELDAYIKKLSKELDISAEAIYAEYKKRVAIRGSNYNQDAQNTSRQVKQSPAISKTVITNGRLELAERKLLNIIIGNKRLIQKAAEEIPAQDYSTDIHRRVASRIYNDTQNGQATDLSVMMCEFSQDDARVISQIFCNPEVFENEEEAVTELISSVKIARIEEQLKGETNPAVIKELIAQRSNLGRK